MTAVVEPDRNAVRLDFTVPAGADRLTVFRVGPSSTRADIRGYVAATVAPGGIVVRDFEAPIGVPLTYTAETWAAATPGTVTSTVVGTVTVPDGGCDDTWLTDLARAGNTQRITIEALDELVHEIPVGVHRILNRRSPIAVSDIAWTPSFELLFLTETDTARERARAALGNGVPVLLRTPPANGIGNMYFTVTGFMEQRVVKPARVQDRRFAVSCVQVDRPSPELFTPLLPTTYADLEMNFATYAELLAERASYDAVLYDWAGAGPSDVVPWPPTDV